MLLPRSYKQPSRIPFRVLTAFLFICTAIIPFAQRAQAQNQSVGGTKAVAADSNTVSEMKKAEEELKKTKEERDKLNSQIDSERGKQTKLLQEAQYIDSSIRQSELQEESVRLEIKQLNLEISILNDEKAEMEQRLTEIQKKIENLTLEMQQSTNLLYKMTLNLPTFLEKNTHFEDAVVKQEETKSMVQIIKSNITEIQQLEAEVKEKKDEISKKQENLSSLQSQKEAQTANLDIQQQGLEWQKTNKVKLAEQSKLQQSLWSMDRQALNAKIVEVEKKLNELRSRALSLPPSGTPVKAGQVIGQQGATGYVTGSHLHFEYKLSAGGERLDPEKYRSTFAVQPMDKMLLTSGYGPRCFTYNGKQVCDFHTGGDYVNYNGAPIYAIKSGKVDYFCDSYGGLGAIVFHDDGSRSLYWHIQKVPGCKPLAGY